MATVQRELERLEADVKRSGRSLMPTAAHFLYIPGVLLLGIVIGWILGSRAAADAYAAQLRSSRQAERATEPQSHAETDEPTASGSRSLADASSSACVWSALAPDGQPLGEHLGQAGGDDLGLRRARRRRSTRMTVSVRASVSRMPNAARGSPSRGWPTAPQFTR